MGRWTILVTEDESGIRGPVRRVLAAQGFAVLEAAGGPQALELATGHAGPIDLLLTDVVMPGMGGGELAHRMRALRPGIRILFMSGNSPESMTTQGVLPPGTTLLQKPFTIEELVRRVREVLESEV